MSGQNSLLPLVEGAGVYDIQLTDVSNGCSASQQVEVVQLDRPVGSVQADDVRCYGEANGSIQVLVGAGGTAPFEFSIDNQTFTTDSIFENLPAGQYEVYVRDANDCGFSTVVTIAEPTPFSVELTGDVLAIPGVPANLQVLLSPPGFVPTEIEWEANNVVLNEQHRLETSLELLQTTLFQVKNKRWKWLFRVGYLAG